MQWAVNGALIAIAAVTLFPLAWMVAGSLMAPGEASTYPPPLVPREPTLANYRELFARAGMTRYLMNSVLLAVAVTALSLAFNVAAGYAFAKLRFRGRDRIFRAMLGALVIPRSPPSLTLQQATNSGCPAPESFLPFTGRSIS